MCCCWGAWVVRLLFELLPIRGFYLFCLCDVVYRDVTLLVGSIVTAFNLGFRVGCLLCVSRFVGRVVSCVLCW
jgi:hypothetical protein